MEPRVTNPSSPVSNPAKPAPAESEPDASPPADTVPRREVWPALRDALQALGNTAAIAAYLESTAEPEPDRRRVPIKPTRDISAQARRLLKRLPTQDQVPAGFVMIDEAEQSREEVIAAYHGTEEVAQLLDDWGWSGTASSKFRESFSDEAAVAPREPTFLTVSVHRFADAGSAVNAIAFFSDRVISAQDHSWVEVDPPTVGEIARLLEGNFMHGNRAAALYAQQGPIMYHIWAVANNTDRNYPTTVVLAVADEIVSGQTSRG